MAEAAHMTRETELRDTSSREDTELRIRHASEVERLQSAICSAALGARGEEQASVPYRYNGAEEQAKRRQTQYRTYHLIIIP
jgi:hypothetical protein